MAAHGEMLLGSRRNRGGRRQARKGKMLMNCRGEKNKVEKKRKTNEWK